MTTLSQMRIISATVFLLFVPAILLAQRDLSSLTGNILDTTSGLPVRRSAICETLGNVVNCRQADSLGHFVYEGLVPGNHFFSVSCDNGNTSILRSGELLDTLRLTLEPGERRDIRLTVDATHCDQRPFEATTGEFRGHYSSGFELSTFVPCDGAPGRPAWVEFTDKASNQDLPPWPRPDSAQTEYKVYVRWVGTLVGPYRYGHLSLAHYQLRVDSILEVRWPRTHDCDRAAK